MACLNFSWRTPGLVLSPVDGSTMVLCVEPNKEESLIDYNPNKQKEQSVYSGQVSGRRKITVGVKVKE